jgi:hypothetical protein
MRACIVVLATTWVISGNTLGHAQSLDFQAMCATQARKAFQEWEQEFRSGALGKMYVTVSSDYQTHYNTKLQKCLMLIEATRMLGNQSSTSAILTDAYERRIYASYLWISRENTKYWEVSPTNCELVLSLRQKKYCTTREEFDAFVADYMEE